jgi:hypothetical protein
MQFDDIAFQGDSEGSDYDRLLKHLQRLYDVAIVQDEGRVIKVHAMPPFSFPDDPEDYGIAVTPRLLCFDKYTHLPMRMYYRQGGNKELVEAAFEPYNQRWEKMADFL